MNPMPVHQCHGARQSSPNATLPFDTVCIWYDVKLQSPALHNPATFHPVQTLESKPSR